MKEFRQLTVADTAEYHKVLIDGYAAIKDYPISFDAIDFTEEESKEWIENYCSFCNGASFQRQRICTGSLGLCRGAFKRTV